MILFAFSSARSRLLLFPQPTPVPGVADRKITFRSIKEIADRVVASGAWAELRTGLGGLVRFGGGPDHSLVIRNPVTDLEFQHGFLSAREIILEGAVERVGS